MRSRRVPRENFQRALELTVPLSRRERHFSKKPTQRRIDGREGWVVHLGIFIQLRQGSVADRVPGMRAQLRVAYAHTPASTSAAATSDQTSPRSIDAHGTDGSSQNQPGELDPWNASVASLRDMLV